MNTTEFIRTVRTIVKQVIDDLKPVKIMYGTIKEINPLKVFVDQRLTLTEDFFIVPKHLQSGYTAEDCEGRAVTVDSKLNVGDKVIVLRDHGGQKFLIMGVVE